MPKGWIIEQQLVAYGNKDYDKAFILKLVEDNPLTVMRNRALVFVTINEKGDLKNDADHEKLAEEAGNRLGTN